jgi:hypothetical protein
MAQQRPYTAKGRCEACGQKFRYESRPLYSDADPYLKASGRKKYIGHSTETTCPSCSAIGCFWTFMGVVLAFILIVLFLAIFLAVTD